MIGITLLRSGGISMWGERDKIRNMGLSGIAGMSEFGLGCENRQKHNSCKPRGGLRMSFPLQLKGYPLFVYICNNSFTTFIRTVAKNTLKTQCCNIVPTHQRPFKQPLSEEIHASRRWRPTEVEGHENLKAWISRKTQFWQIPLNSAITAPQKSSRYMEVLGIMQGMHKNIRVIEKNSRKIRHANLSENHNKWLPWEL